MQLLPIEAIGTIANAETVDGAMMQPRQHAGMVLGPHATNHGGATPDSSQVSAAVDPLGMDTTAHAANVSALAGEATDMHAAACVDATNMRARAKAADVAHGSHPTEMRAAAQSSHVAASTEAAAACLRCSREQARRKQGRGQNRR